MRRGIKTLILAATVAVLWSPAPASADGFVSPWVGSNFAREPADGQVGSFGVTAGSMGGGIIGGEFDFGYSPSFWDKDRLRQQQRARPHGQCHRRHSDRWPERSGNTAVRDGWPGHHPHRLRRDCSIPTQLEHRLRVQPRRRAVMGYFGTHFGLRGDLRYMRTINSDVTDRISIPSSDSATSTSGGRHSALCSGNETQRHRGDEGLADASPNPLSPTTFARLAEPASFTSFQNRHASSLQRSIHVSPSSKVSSATTP